MFEFSWGAIIKTDWLMLNATVYWGILYLSLFSTLITLLFVNMVS